MDRLLRSKMALFGDNCNSLANALKITPQTLSKKMHNKGAEFTQSEIVIMISRYDLSPEDVNTIFFNA